VPGWGIYFGFYELLKEKSPEIKESKRLTAENKKRLENLWILNAGGMAGLISWVFSMP
jgi:hypothetical protein